MARIAPKTPIDSRISRLPWESAIGRKPLAGSGAASTSSTATPLARRLNASAAPTGPPPAIRTSQVSAAAGIAHERFDLGDELRRVGGEDLAAGRGDEHVVLDAHADVPEALGHVLGRPDVAARLDGERHARPERLPFAAVLVVAGVVHVEPEPVPGAMHVEALVVFRSRAPCRARPGTDRGR